VLFNADCNEQVFPPNPEKNLAQIHLVTFEKKKKNVKKPTLVIIPKNDVSEPKARLL